jgi:5-methylcytosine-specific restriction endonuclease McrA
MFDRSHRDKGWDELGYHFVIGNGTSSGDGVVEVGTRWQTHLDSSVLMLNAHYMAMRIVSVRRAFTLLFKRDRSDQPVAEIVSVEDGKYISYDFADWTELSAFRKEFEPNGHDWIHTVRFDIVVPRIIRVLTFAKLPRQEVKFNRRNLFARDHNTCQYCGKHHTTSQLSLDHVIPRSRGGKTTWDNIVAACLKCNVQSGRTPPKPTSWFDAHQAASQPGHQRDHVRQPLLELEAISRHSLLGRRTPPVIPSTFQGEGRVRARTLNFGNAQYYL